MFSPEVKKAINQNETHLGLISMCRIWLGIGDENQTFEDELQFDVNEEIECIYVEPEELEL
jgi:hypothetical protein